MNKFIVLAKLGIIESNDSQGNDQIQRIDDPEGFAFDNEFDFIPPLLESDEVAQEMYDALYPPNKIEK